MVKESGLIKVDINKLTKCINDAGYSVSSVMVTIGANASYLSNIRARNGRINAQKLDDICTIIGEEKDDFIINPSYVETCFGKKLKTSASESDKKALIASKKSDFAKFMNPPIEEETPRPSFEERMKQMRKDDRETRVTFRTENIPDRVFDPSTLDLNYEKAWNNLKKWAVEKFLDNDTVDIPVSELLMTIKRLEIR